MNPLLMNEIVALCKRRQQQGDHPTEPPASIETLENTVVELATRLDGPLAKAKGVVKHLPFFGDGE